MFGSVDLVMTSRTLVSCLNVSGSLKGCTGIDTVLMPSALPVLRLGFAWTVLLEPAFVPVRVMLPGRRMVSNY